MEIINNFGDLLSIFTTDSEKGKNIENKANLIFKKISDSNIERKAILSLYIALKLELSNRFISLKYIRDKIDPSLSLKGFSKRLSEIKSELNLSTDQNEFNDCLSFYSQFFNPNYYDRDLTKIFAIINSYSIETKIKVGTAIYFQYGASIKKICNIIKISEKNLTKFIRKVRSGIIHNDFQDLQKT